MESDAAVDKPLALFAMSTPSSRREFLEQLSSIGAVAALVTTPNTVFAQASGATRRNRTQLTMRGLAPADDFGFEPGLAYLQTGSLGATPRPVMEKVMAWWKALELDPTLHGYGDLEKGLDTVREHAAAFLGCQTDELVLTNCTTEGMNWIAQGLSFSTGDRILTTDQEHPGGRVCWDYVARRFGVVIDEVKIPNTMHDPAMIVDAFAQRLTAQTRVMSFSHVLTSTGYRMPVAELSALARSRNCLSVVDGAQAIGGIDVNLKALDCDAYATSGHKWLLAPKGTGLLYLRSSLGSRIDPIALQSGRQGYSASSGVCSIPSVLGLGDTIDYIKAIGLANIERHNRALRDYTYRALQSVAQLTITSPPPGPFTTGMVSYALPASVPSGTLREALRTKHKVQVKVVPANFFNGHRISTHLFNTERDVDRLIGALKSELT